MTQVAGPVSGGTASAARTLWLKWVVPVLVAAANFVAVFPVARAFSYSGVIVAAAIAAVISVAISFVLVDVLRWPPTASYGASLIGLIVFLLAFAGPHPGSIASSVARAPNHLLTETLPLSGGAVASAGVIVLIWVAAAATSEALLRSGRDRRRATPWGMVVPPVVFIASYAATSSAPGGAPVAGAVLFFLLVALLVLWRASAEAAAPVREVVGAAGSTGSSPDGEPPQHRGAVIGLACAAAAAVAVYALAPVVPGLRQKPVGLQRQPPVTSPQITDPLGVMSELRDSAAPAPTTELSLTTSAPSNGYLGVAYLDDYDGSQWQFTATFQPTGGRVPAATGPSAVGTTAVSQKVKLDTKLPLPLLPALDRPVSVSGTTVLADADSGMVLSEKGGAGTDYSVTSMSPANTLTSISPADGPGSSATYPDDIVTPANTGDAMAAAIRFVAGISAAKPGDNIAFLQAAAAALRKDERRVEPAPATPPASARIAPTATTAPLLANGGGTSLSQVIVAVTVHEAATPEQFATFFAMMARYLGIPARVVTGFRVVNPTTSVRLPAGTYKVTDKQAWTWDEIAVAGLGWVVVDPTPGTVTTRDNTPVEHVTTSPTTVPPRQANAVPSGVRNGGHALAPRHKVASGNGGSVSGWLFGILIGLGSVVALLALAAGQAALRRALRRRRRRDPDPAQSVVGAWMEMLDGLARAGMRSPPGATAHEIAADVGRHFGTEHVATAGAVAALADRAVFSPSRPPGAEEAEQAWTTQAGIVRDVLSGLDRSQRARAVFLVGKAHAATA